MGNVTNYKDLSNEQLNDLTDPNINKGGIPMAAVREVQVRKAAGTWTTNNKLFLCQEGRKKFYIEAVDKDEAESAAEIYNAAVLREVPMTNLNTISPNKA